MKLNQIILVVAILIVLGWNIRRARVEKLEGVKSDVVLYVEDSTTTLKPFVIYAMAKKLTSDQTKLEKILKLAEDNNKKELLKILETL